VAEVAVIGVPDERWGEVGCAFVVRAQGVELTEAGLIEFCYSRLARYKVPKHVVFTDAIPRTASGKVQKHILREMWLSRRT
jgi:Acyl-CoA synthetases (AMP-forming)/AMP-acid ligases II